MGVRLSNTKKNELQVLVAPGTSNVSRLIRRQRSLVPVCQGCYAVTGFYKMKNVTDVREFNKEDWKRDLWVTNMVEALDTERHFRWFESGSG